MPCAIVTIATRYIFLIVTNIALWISANGTIRINNVWFQVARKLNRDSFFYGKPVWNFTQFQFIKAVTRPISSLPPWVNEHKELVIVVSWASIINFRLALTLWISFIYIMNSRGPNQESWGTPVSISRVDKGMPSYSTYWRCCVR